MAVQEQRPQITPFRRRHPKSSESDFLPATSESDPHLADHVFASEARPRESVPMADLAFDAQLGR
jgi:hypothetical protein